MFLFRSSGRCFGLCSLEMLECTWGPREPKVRVTEEALVLSLAEYLSEQYLEDTECPWAKLFSI